MKKVGIVFGTFDGLHAGHSFFIEEAQKLAGRLIVVVAPDAIVKKLKNRKPMFTLSTRKRNLRETFPGLTVVSGDRDSNSWNILKKFSPEIVILGYDQKDLRRALKAYDPKIKLKIIRSHQGQTHHSSILNKS